MPEQNERRSNDEIIEENLKTLEDINDAADASALTNEDHPQYKEKRAKIQLIKKAEEELARHGEIKKLSIEEERQLEAMIGPVIRRLTPKELKSAEEKAAVLFEQEQKKKSDSERLAQLRGEIASIIEAKATSAVKEPIMVPEKPKTPGDPVVEEKKEAETKLKKPEGISLSKRLNELENNPDALEHLKTQLAGEKVYHFTKDENGQRVKQYLSLQGIDKVDGKWQATLVYYKETGEEVKRVENYNIDKTKCKEWKKELPKEDKESALWRHNTKGYIEGEMERVEEKDGSISYDFNQKEGSTIAFMHPDKIIRYQEGNIVAYAVADPGRPKYEGKKDENPAPILSSKIDKQGIEVETQSIESLDKEKAKNLTDSVQKEGYEDPERLKEYHEFLDDLIDRYEALIPIVKEQLSSEKIYAGEVSKIEGNIKYLQELVVKNELPAVGLKKFKEEEERVYKTWSDNYSDNFDFDLDDTNLGDGANDVLPSEVDVDGGEDMHIEGGGKEEEKPNPKPKKVGFWGRLGNSLGLFRSKEQIAKELKEIDERIEMDEGKPYICKKCGHEYILDMGNPSCPSCGGITPFLKKLKKRKRQIEKEGHLSSGPEVENLSEDQIVSEEETTMSKTVESKSEPKKFTPADILKILKVEAGVNASAEDVWRAMHNYRLGDVDKTAQIDDVIIKFSKNIIDGTGTIKEAFDDIEKYFGLKERGKNNG